MSIQSIDVRDHFNNVPPVVPHPHYLVENDAGTVMTVTVTQIGVAPPGLISSVISATGGSVAGAAAGSGAFSWAGPMSLTDPVTDDTLRIEELPPSEDVRDYPLRIIANYVSPIPPPPEPGPGDQPKFCDGCFLRILGKLVEDDNDRLRFSVTVIASHSYLLPLRGTAFPIKIEPFTNVGKPVPSTVTVREGRMEIHTFQLPPAGETGRTHIMARFISKVLRQGTNEPVRDQKRFRVPAG